MDLVEARARGFEDGARHPWERARVRIVDRLIGAYVEFRPGDVVVDIGCGDTFVVEHLARRHPELTFHAVDSAFTTELIELFRKRLSVSNISLHTSLDEVKLDRSAALVLLMDVVEHVPDDAGFLNDVSTRPWVDARTRVLLTVPSYPWLFSKHDEFLGHYRRYSTSTLRRVLGDSRLSAVESGYLFASLLPARLAQIVRERLFPSRQEPAGLSAWRGGRVVTRSIAAALTLDGRIGLALRRLGVDLPRTFDLRDMPEVCVVVPCYNEERRFKSDAFAAFLDAHPQATLFLVDDGSRDGTSAVLERLKERRPNQVLVHRLTSNGGKAEAVRAGVLHAAALGTWPVLGYWDADLSTPLDEVDRLLATLREFPDCQLALGSRVKRLGSDIDRNASRHVLGRVFAACASAILGLEVYDSQCGAKLFRTEAAQMLFREPFLTRWLFDLELLVRLRNNVGISGMGAAREVPLGTWKEVGGSKLKASDMITVPMELLKIRAHYNTPPR